jgi:hypothetical protein
VKSPKTAFYLHKRPFFRPNHQRKIVKTVLSNFNRQKSLILYSQKQKDDKTVYFKKPSPQSRPVKPKKLKVRQFHAPIKNRPSSPKPTSPSFFLSFSKKSHSPIHIFGFLTVTQYLHLKKNKID